LMFAHEPGQGDLLIFAREPKSPNRSPGFVAIAATETWSGAEVL
jgi:hypothetical protein